MRIIPLQFGRQRLFQTGFQRQCRNGNVRSSVRESGFICGAADFFFGGGVVSGFFITNETTAEQKNSHFKHQCFFQKLLEA